MKKYLIIACLVFAGMPALFAQTNFWEKTPAPPGGDISVIPTAGGTLYGFAMPTFPDPELYRSSDTGHSWTRIDPRYNNQSIAGSIDIAPDGTFYYTRENSNSDYRTLLRSADEGITWEIVNDSVQHYRLAGATTGTLMSWGKVDTANAVVVWRSTDGGQSWAWALTLPQWVGNSMVFREMPNGSLILERPDNFLLYHSENDGQSWAEVPMPTPQGAGPLYISHAGTWFVLQWGSFLRSTNQGQSWEPLQGVDPSEKLNTLTSLPSGRLLAASKANQRLYYSDDEGAHWQLSPSGYAIGALKLAAPLPDGRIFATSKESLYRSTDGGEHWTFSAHGLTRGNLIELAFLNKDTAFAATLDGVFRSVDQGQSWQHIAQYKRNFADYSLFDTYQQNISTGQQFLLAGVDSSILLSGNWGADFTGITPADGLADFKVKISPGDSLFFINRPSGLSRSDDGGAHWQTVAGNLFFTKMVFHPSGRYFALLQDYPGQEGGALWFSDNFGLSWQPQGDYCADICFQPSGTIFAFSANGLIFSENGGNSWSLRLMSFLFDGSGHFCSNAAGHLLASSANTIYRSLDDGVTWQLLPDVYEEFPGISSITETITLRPDQVLMAVTTSDGIYRTRIPTTQGAYLNGHVYRDADGDCSTPDAQMPLANWMVTAEGTSTFFTNTDSAGVYRFFIDTGSYEVSVRSPQDLWWGFCDSVQTAVLDTLLNVDSLDFSGVAFAECPLITVELSISRLRRCFDNLIYVHYCNQGAEPADSAWVDISLDPYLTLVTSAQPYSPLGNHTFRFFVGDIPSGHCDQFSFAVNVDCDSTVLGQTHCITAHGYPDTLCTPVPAWSGAEIRASVSCQDTTLQFHLRNAGTAPSQVLDYIIIEDDVVLLQGNHNYQPDDILTLDVPANGHTWRIESEQEPGHPFSMGALAFAEGCGGFQSLGFINQFNVDAFTPSWDQDCVENTGSYDPNDKQGFPLGTGAEHLIRPGQELEYLIRFQNTGTDTAFTVVVRDTLSPWLDPASVRPGAASHPYTWALSGQGVLSFTFDNIHLPDSNVNEATSHGFVSFRIAQQPDLPLGAVIYNEADIYFDFNEPVRTNQTWHTIGIPATVGLQATPQKNAPSEILVAPQPAETYTVLQRADGRPFNHSRFYLLDALGHSVLETRLEGSLYRFERNELPAGLYFYRIETADGQPAGSGRLALQR